jgi:alpha-ketoglutarate-dependent taurine dioxygenase
MTTSSRKAPTGDDLGSEQGYSMHPVYDTSKPALENFATGNAHYDCRKYGTTDAPFLCYLASDRDCISAEAAFDRLRSLLSEKEMQPHLVHIYQTATLIKLGNEDITLRAAAEDLLTAMDHAALTPVFATEVTLTQSTGVQPLDQLLGRVVADLLAVFGERLFCAYAVGSAFDGSGVKSSDVDLHLLFKGAHSAYLKQAVHEFSKTLSQKHGVDLDLIPFFESDIKPWADVRTKLGGLQIFGNCSTEDLVLPPMDEYVRENMHRAYFYMARARQFPDSLTYPVTAPDQADRFAGYNSRRHEDGSPSTKELVVVAGWLSTALVTRRAQCYIASKSASYGGYRQHVCDEWTAHLQDVFELVRQKWNYRVPEGEDETEQLAAICRRQVDFENHFLREYEKFLKEESASASGLHADRASKLHRELFPADATEPLAKRRLTVPAWQVCTRRGHLNARLVSVDHFLVKTPSLRDLSDKALREAFQRWEEFGVVVFACKDTHDLRHDLLGLQQHFGQVVFHPRSDKTGITSVRNMFKPEQGFAGTTNAMQTPHTDGSFLARPPGIVALQTEICGLCGGESTLVFGDALYRHMQQHHAADLQKLFNENAYTIGRSGEQATRPVFWREDGRVHMAFRCGNGEELDIAIWARRGFNAIYDYVNSASNQLRFRLPGNHVLVVDNQRNLHGRLRWPADTVRCLNRLWLDGAGTSPAYPGLGMRNCA